MFLAYYSLLNSRSKAERQTSGFHNPNATINSSGSSNYTILHSHHSDHHLHGLGSVFSCYETVLSTTPVFFANLT
jgi:hypothetical protein